jgi:hypothetical protein
MEQRISRRVRVFRLIYFQSDRYPNDQVASTHDLSAGGAGIESGCSIVPGDVLRISLVIPPQIIRCKAKVVHALRLMAERVRAGVQFEDISKEDFLFLEGYLSHFMIPQREGNSLVGLGLLIALGVSLLAWAAIIYLISRLI